MIASANLEMRVACSVQTVMIASANLEMRVGARQYIVCVRRYVDAEGRRRVVGGKKLKLSQHYPRQFGDAVAAWRQGLRQEAANIGEQERRRLHVGADKATCRSEGASCM